MEIFFRNIRHLNKVNNFTAEKLALKFNTDIDLFKRIETGETEPDLKILAGLADIYGVSLDSLFKKDFEKIAGLKRAEIKMLVLDVDGVLTDGGMYYTESGDEFKRFNTKDGMAIRRLTKNGMEVAFLSSGINEKLIRSRAEHLGVKRVYVGTDEKAGILENWRMQAGVEYDQIAMVGDDINDLEIMGKCGLTACPSDAVNKIKDKVDVVLCCKGGEGCIREFIENYLMEI